MKKNTMMVLIITVVIMNVWTGSAFCATAPRIAVPSGEEEDTGLTIFAYENPPFTTTETPEQGVLAEIVMEALKDEDVDAEVTVEISPTKSLMKYSLIQDIGLAALGSKADFTEDELKHLTEIPLYEKGEVTFSIFFNKEHDEGESLAELFKKNLEEMKKNGKMDEILKKLP